MSPSEIPNQEVSRNDLVESEKKAHSGIDSNGNSQSGNTPPIESKEKKKKGSQEQSKPKDTSKDRKISGAELKKQAKEEKAAKRAREKQNQQQPSAEGPGNSRGDSGNNTIKKGVVPSIPETSVTPKHQHKRTGSMSANQQKILPLRSSETVTTAASSEPKKEDKKVALFGHLYGNPRRTTIAGAAKDVHPAVLALGLQMSNYVICGSNARCVATMLVFKRVIESYVTPPHNSLPRHLAVHLSSQIDYIVSCRPLSVSMGNAIRWLKVEISEVDPDTPESKAKADLCDAIDNFIQERITVADQVIATSAAEKICDGDTILTYAKSSIVQQILAEAFRQGKKFKVIVVDSRPLFEGKNLARALADLGLEVQYSLTQAITHAIKGVTKVFLGAHAMMSNGRLYSRVGTAIVAMTAKDSDIPVIVCCESVKFTDRVALDSIVMNEVAPPDELVLQGNSSTSLSKWRDTPNLQLLNLMYDLTPADYITMIITEYGSLPPSSVPVVHRLSTNT